MNRIEIKKIIVNKHKITVSYEVTGEWERFFEPDTCFWVEYRSEIGNVPESIAVIPILGTLLTLSWIYDGEIVVNEIDKAFYESIPEIKKGYETMYPNMNFKGKLSVKKVVENNGKAEKSGSLFSGGVDAFQTMLSHIDENPVLLSVWGADVACDNNDGWRNVEKHIKETSERFELNYEVIHSNFRKIVDEGFLHGDLMKKTGDGWWHGFQSGTGMLTLMAPYAYCYGLNKIYIASSFTKKLWGQYTCSSDPIIDNYIKYAHSQVVHDGYELDRQDKIHKICEFAKTTGRKIPLRVCWKSATGDNCCNCEKCYRTILGIYAERNEPTEYGFNYTKSDFRNMINNLKFKEIVTIRYYGLQAALRKNYKYREVDKSVRWLYKKQFPTDEKFYIHRKRKALNRKEYLFSKCPVCMQKLYHYIKEN